MAVQPWRTGKVIRIENITHNTKRFWIQVPELERFDFVPGQFVTLDLPIHEKVNKRWRSYSIASWPDGTNVFELVIVLTPGGTGTKYLFHEISPGSEIIFRGAQGVFVLPEEIDRDLFLISTGTGIAPFRSMVQHLRLHPRAHKNIYLIFGSRTREDLLYYDELVALQEKLTGFHYFPTLSRAEWEGRKGYVHAIYEELCHDKRAASFYLCGWKNMIDEAKKRIVELGYERKDVHQEVYG
jgi:CDP-4-dehydro-6-deoxyglucose reductase